MRIAIDARPASHPQPGGFKRYTEQLLEALAQIDEVNTYHVYFDRVPAQNAFADKPNFQTTILPARVPNLSVMWREQVSVPQQAKRDRTDVLHFPANSAARHTACATVVTMHDIIFLDEQLNVEQLPLAEKIKRYGMHLYGRWSAQAGAKNARHLITVSEYSKRKIIERFHFPQEQCTVVYSGVSPQFRLLPESSKQTARASLGGSKPFVLGLASASPRKNAGGLIAAYAALEQELQETHDLVLVCTHGLLQQQLKAHAQSLGVSPHTRFLSNVSDDTLAELMNLAQVFVFPSLEEGFGLPPLEAMACGTPVVASNTSSLPEILGDAALLADPMDAGAFARALSDLLRQPALSEEYRARGRARAATFSWERCAEQTLAVYRKASSAQ